MWGLTKLHGRPIHPELQDMYDWPHTITAICAIRQKYDGFQELPEVPPVEHWDFPAIIDRHIEKIYPSSRKKNYEVDVTDVDD